jgi:type I restriction enzyme R subunit
MGVETQSGKYMDGLPNGLPSFRLPLPFAYESTGTVTHFTNALEPDARSRELFTFHRPEELIRLTSSTPIRCTSQRAASCWRRRGCP